MRPLLVHSGSGDQMHADLDTHQDQAAGTVECGEDLNRASWSTTEDTFGDHANCKMDETPCCHAKEQDFTGVFPLEYLQHGRQLCGTTNDQCWTKLRMQGCLL